MPTVQGTDGEKVMGCFLLGHLHLSSDGNMVQLLGTIEGLLNCFFLTLTPLQKTLSCQNYFHYFLGEKRLEIQGSQSILKANRYTMDSNQPK